MRDILKLARTHQWIKNVFCLAGVFFGGHLFAWPLVGKAVLIFAGFCALSSAVYIFNDVHDRESDRRHPHKRDRPLVRGTIRVRTAVGVAVALLVAGFFLLAPLEETFGVAALIAGGYVLLNIAYTLWLKKIPVLDVNVIALGFVLRVAAGAFGIGIVPTQWILLCTYFLALLVAFGKRRAELFVAIEEGDEDRGDATERRQALGGYTLEMLDIGLAVCVALVIASYSLYCVFSHDNLYILATVVPVVVGSLRYLGIAREGSAAERPEALLATDRLLLVDVIVWGILFGFVLYGLPAG